MADSLASAISQAAQTGGLQMRTGRVVYLDASQISVRVAGGDPIAMSSPRGNRLVLGDYVQVLGQGGVWWCLGAPDGIPPDSVLANGSFETDPPGTTSPTSWTVYKNPAKATLASVTVAAATNYAVDGNNVLGVTDGTAAGSDTYISSEAIPVAPGQLWTAAAQCSPYISGTLAGSGVQLFVTFHTNSTTTYPTFVGPLGIIESFSVPLGGASDWSLLRQHAKAVGLMVPSGLNISHMRVVLNTYINGPGRVDWDCVICRRIDT